MGSRNCSTRYILSDYDCNLCNSMTKSNYLTEDELLEVKKAFQIFDQDNSGSITTQELDNILKSLGQYLDKEELDELV